jgi:hypothetical protein
MQKASHMSHSLRIYLTEISPVSWDCRSATASHLLTSIDRFQPPLTGFAATHWSTSSEWIVKLFKEAGA